MDQASLVNVDVAAGAEILNILDGAGLDVKVALWAILPEFEDWRIVLAGKRFDEVDLRQAYRLVNSALIKEQFPAARTPPLMILPMSDSTIRALRRVFSKTKDVNGMRLGGQMIGNRFIDDAIAYRIR